MPSRGRCGVSAAQRAQEKIDTFEEFGGEVDAGGMFALDLVTPGGEGVGPGGDGVGPGAELVSSTTSPYQLSSS
jgi:hypothetical protein